jgi:hypothetical protein
VSVIPLRFIPAFMDKTKAGMERIAMTVYYQPPTPPTIMKHTAISIVALFVLGVCSIPTFAQGQQQFQAVPFTDVQ